MSSAFPGQFSPIPNSFQAIDVANGAASQLTVPAGAKYALVQALTNSVNWRDDGVAPTNGVGGGMVLLTGVPAEGFLGDLALLRFISTNVAGSKLLVSYYG